MVAIVVGYLTIAKIIGCGPFPVPPDVEIDIASSRFNPKGDEDSSDEYVCLVNEDDDSVELTGWVLRDSEGDVNVLPRFTLEAGAAVRVHPGPGRDTASDLFGEEGSTAWRNGGESVTLLSDDDETIDATHYSVRDQGDGGRCAP